MKISHKYRINNYKLVQNALILKESGNTICFLLVLCIAWHGTLACLGIWSASPSSLHIGVSGLLARRHSTRMFVNL
jgi:hypothetical protein